MTTPDQPAAPVQQGDARNAFTSPAHPVEAQQTCNGMPAIEGPLSASQRPAQRAAGGGEESPDWQLMTALAELDGVNTEDKNGCLEAARACIIKARSALLTSRAAPAAPAVEAVTDGEIDAAANDCFTAGNNLTRHQWRTFARAVLALARKGEA